MAGTELSQMDALSRQIELHQRATADIQTCEDIGRVKAVADRATMLKLMARRIHASLELQNAATESSLWARRRQGELLAEMPERRGQHKKSHDGTFYAPVLAELGIKKNESSRAQALASIPEDEFREEIEKAKKSAKELTTKQFVKKGLSLQRDARREELAAVGRLHIVGGDIITGDLSILEERLADDSVDLFLTDPPYVEEGIPLYGRLAELAARKLKPGAFCLAYAGQSHLLPILDEMRKHLDYYWLLVLRHTGGTNQIWNRHVLCEYKPILMFAKRPIQRPAHQWISDYREGGGKDKVYHEWGQDAQEATIWIERLTPPGALVVDPFCGGGSIPAACKATGRRWLATEINEQNAAIARGRIA